MKQPDFKIVWLLKETTGKKHVVRTP